MVYASRMINLLYRSADERTSQGKGVRMDVPAGCSKAAYGISYVNRIWGLQRPVMVLTYLCGGRAVSIRSNTRVITHVIAGYQPGRNAADTYQMLMRAGGSTAEVRIRPTRLLSHYIPDGCRIALTELIASLEVDC